MKFTCRSEKEMDIVAAEVLNRAASTTGNKAFVIGLYGDLGSGKTTFTQHFAKYMGIEDTVTSPTFVIQKNFKIPHDGLKRFHKLYHFDLYRIESEAELVPLSWQYIIDNPNNLVVVEWPEKVQSSLPADIFKLKFTFIDEKTREVEIVEDSQRIGLGTKREK